MREEKLFGPVSIHKDRALKKAYTKRFQQNLAPLMFRRGALFKRNFRRSPIVFLIVLPCSNFILEVALSTTKLSDEKKCPKQGLLKVCLTAFFGSFHPGMYIVEF